MKISKILKGDLTKSLTRRLTSSPALLIAGGLLAISSAARAGEWTIIAPPLCQSSQYYQPPSQADKDAYIALWGDYFSGNVDYYSSTVQCDSYTGYPSHFRSNGGPPDADHMWVNDPNNTGSIPFWEFSAIERMGGDGHYAKASAGGPGHIDINNAKIRYRLKWIPQKIWSSDYQQLVDDPNDVPVGEHLYVHLVGNWTAKSKDGTDNQSHVLGKEHADATLSLVGEGGGASSSQAGVDTGNALVATTNVEKTIKIDVNGRREIWLPWLQISAHASLDGDRWDGPSNNNGGYNSPGYSDPRTWWRDGYEAQSGHFYADSRRYYVYISSDIETSYKKSVISTGPLPNDFYQKDNNGNLVIGTDGQPVLDVGVGHKLLCEPAMTTSGMVYAVRCERANDGSISVESAARLEPDATSNDPDAPLVWKQWPVLHANYLGFTSPEFLWQSPGFGPQPSGTVTTDPSTPPNWTQDSSLSLGESTYTFGNVLQNSLPSTTTTVDVREGDSSQPFVQLQNTYTIKWHPTYERTSDISVSHQSISMGIIASPVKGSLSTPIEAKQQLNIGAGVSGLAGAVGAATGSGGGPAGAAIGASIAAGIVGLLDPKWETGNDVSFTLVPEQQWGYLTATPSDSRYRDNDHILDAYVLQHTGENDAWRYMKWA